MAKRNMKCSLNNKGQTAVEYIFLLAIIAAVVTSILGVIKTKYFGNVSKCTENSKLLVCKINSVFLPNSNNSKHFQTYPFHK